MVDLHVERTIKASPDRVFEWLADPACLTAAPLVVTARWEAGSSAPRVGAVRRVAGIGVWFREEITAYDAPHAYSYLIVRSFPAFGHDGGTLTFTSRGPDTHVDWDTRYHHPLYAGGRAMDAVSPRLLAWSFESVLADCAKRLEA